MKNVIDQIIQAQIGTHKQSSTIEDHMKEYFSRWSSYEDKFTSLEWYHIFLDFYDKILPQINYWKTRCELTEDVLNETPCDPDITEKQIFANMALDKFLNENKA